MDVEQHGLKLLYDIPEVIGDNCEGCFFVEVDRHCVSPCPMDVAGSIVEFIVLLFRLGDRLHPVRDFRGFKVVH